MLWYGFFFYLIFLSALIFLIVACLRLFVIQTIFHFDIYLLILKWGFNFFILFSSSLLLLNYFSYENLATYVILDFYPTASFITQLQLPQLSVFASFNSLMVYYFPFIYIFAIITTCSIIYCLVYNFTELNNFIFYIIIIFIFGTFLFTVNSLILFFFAYEMLLLPSFFILYRFAKTRRSIEAAYLMFFWTQFGAFFLLFSFLYLFLFCATYTFFNLSLVVLSPFEVNFLFSCWLIGFGVKLPLWPFYGWLPRAHVEASTNFSIFLSGVLVKFAFFGLFKCLCTLELEPTCSAIYPFLLIGLSDAVCKLFYQIDLKKLVAYSTVVEMHWLTITLLNGQTGLFLAGFCMLISHALLSTNAFLLVDSINRRFKTRLITEISGINFLTPKLFLVVLVNLLLFLGFPGSLFFIAEVLFFSFLFDFFPLLTFILIFLLYLIGPIFFFRTWLSVMFGINNTLHNKIPLDLDKCELFLYSSLLGLLIWLGLTWQIFLF